MSKFTDVVSWVMPDDKILKLKAKNETYDISEKVYAFLSGKGLLTELEEKSVEVEIDETQGQSGVITHLKIVEKASEVKEEKKVEEAKPVETPPEAQGLVVKEIVVGGVAVDRMGVISKEDKVWYTLDSTIDAQKFKDECTKRTIEITVAPQEKGNDVIKSYILKEESPEEGQSEADAGNEKPQYTNSVQRSIEAQASVNSANEVVAQMKDILNDPQKVLSTITRIAEHNFETIQNLKNKE